MLRIVRKLLHPTAQLCRMNTFDACAYDTPRCLISRTASSLNSRVNCLLSMTHLPLHKTPNLVSSEPGAAHLLSFKIGATGARADKVEAETPLRLLKQALGSMRRRSIFE